MKRFFYARQRIGDGSDGHIAFLSLCPFVQIKLATKKRLISTVVWSVATHVFARTFLTINNSKLRVFSHSRFVEKKSEFLGLRKKLGVRKHLK